MEYLAENGPLFVIDNLFIMSESVHLADLNFNHSWKSTVHNSFMMHCLSETQNKFCLLPTVVMPNKKLSSRSAIVMEKTKYVTKKLPNITIIGNDIYFVI